MDRFLIENADLFQALVKRFDPSKTKTAQNGPASSALPSPDIEVCARIRPLLDDEYSSGFRSAIFTRPSRAGLVDLHELHHSPRGRPKLKSSEYILDRAFGPEVTTEHIYEEVVQGLVPFAWNGGISTLFAYGQTGSGKTHTISRLEQLVINDLLDGSRNLSGSRKIYLTVIELAGNAAFDLLNWRKSVSILEDAFGDTQILGAVEHLVTDADDSTRLVELANSLRHTTSTEKNDQSSRSHAICRLRIEKADDPPAEDGILYLIDLAGSEAARDRLRHDVERMRETLQINKSLSILKDCMRGKVEADAAIFLHEAEQKDAKSPKKMKKPPHVPFRQSALTKMLKHVFDPASRRACKTVVVACVNPSNVDCPPSRNTLQFAEMLRVMVPAMKQVEYRPDAPMTWTNIQLKSWIDTNSGNPPISSSRLAPSESGARLLRLSDHEFDSRCLTTPGVTTEQAQTFRSKLWQLHIDSQHTQEAVNLKKAGVMEVPRARTSSRDPDPKAENVPFKDRIRPGMVVQCTSTKWLTGAIKTDTSCLVIVLSLASAVNSNVQDFEGKLIKIQDLSADGYVMVNRHQPQYLCAILTPGMLGETYEINMWKQIVVGVEAMEKEVILEYDTATRYYYTAI